MKSAIRAAMATLTAIFVCYAVLGAATGEQIISDITDRQLSLPPQSPEKIGTTYYLVTRENPKPPQLISAMDLSALNGSSFRTSRRTVLIVHGMDDQAHDNWVSDMCQELLLKEDVNCIGVDWRNGSGNVLTYLQAVGNVRVVGGQICQLLNTLLAEMNYFLTYIHIIGHSLGAHIAGEAGKQCPGIRRITGLDPAGPLFIGANKDDRLDPSDAEHVDAIYTDTELIIGLGIAQVVAHLNFYPNGGKNMAGCPGKVIGLLNVTDLKESVACDHFRAYRYYIDSIRNPEGYISYPCDNYDNFKSGVCFPCPPQGCPFMGYYAERWFNKSDQEQKFYLNTGGTIPYFSSWRYGVSLTLNGKTSECTYISIYGSGGDVTNHQIGSGLTLIPRDKISEFMDSPVKLHPVRHVTFYWTSALINLFQTKLGAARIDIQTGEDGTISSFCGKGMALNGVVQVLDPCP